MSEWTLLTTHARVLVCVARGHQTRLRDIAQGVGITERAAQTIIRDLVEAGYLTRHRIGTRNFYEVHPDAPARHPSEGDIEIGDLLAVVLKKTGWPRS